MGRRIRTALRSFAIVLAFVVAFGFAVGARPVYAYRELQCAEGYTAQPVSIAPISVCRPANPDPTAIQWPRLVVTQQEIALYLANLRVRVFDIDVVGGTSGGLVFDVAAPP
jgi:hypothetical protein